MSFQGSVTSAAQSIVQATGIKSIVAQEKQDTADAKVFAETMEKIQSGEDVSIKNVPAQYQERVKQAQELQQALDKATAETALNTAQRLMGGNDPLAAFRIKNLKQRQDEEKTRHISRERMLDNLYGKKQS